MAYTLLLKECENSGEPEAPTAETEGSSLYDWALGDPSGQLVAMGEKDSRAGIEARLQEVNAGTIRIVGVISAFDVTCCTARIPGRQKRMIQQALPFAVEEQIAQDIDSVHLALGSQSNNEWRVAVIDLETIERHLESFREWDYPIAGLYADAMLVPLDSNQWTILVASRHALIHGLDGSWYAVPVEALSVFVDSLVHSRESGDTPPGIRVLATPEAREQHGMALAALDQNPDALIRLEELQQPLMPWLTQGLNSAGAGVINLCQGRFAPADSRRSPLRRWRPVAVVAALGLVLQLGLMVAEGRYYLTQAERLNEQAMGIYNNLFPGDSRVDADNLKRVLTGKLRAAEQGGGGGDFLTLLRFTGHQYQQLSNTGSLRFETIQFSSQRGQLRIELHGQSFSQLDAMRTGLSDLGLESSIGSVVNSDDGTRARLTITQGG